MKCLLPKEHGLLAWVTVPLVGAALLCPRTATFVAIGAVISAFFSFNAFRRRERAPALGMLLLSGGLGWAALTLATTPGVLVVLGLIGLPILGFSALSPVQELPRRPLLELGAIGFLSALGAAVAVAGGAAAGPAALVAAISASWLVLGMWKLREQFATILPKRRRWPGGAWAGGLAVSATAATGLILGAPLAGLVPLLYPLRLGLHRRPHSAVELKKVGMTELFWALGAVSLGVLVSRGAALPL